MPQYLSLLTTMPRNNTAIKAIAFDFDGLMFNTEDLWDVVTKTLLARRDREPSGEFTRQVTGRPARIALPMLLEWFELDDTVDQIQAEIDSLFDELLPNHLAPMPGLRSLLCSIEAASLPRAITTSSSRSFIENVIGVSKLMTEFEFFLTAESVSEGKPNPEIYLAAAERFGISPSEMMVLEDSENGCRAATAAGAFVVAVPTHATASHDFAKVQFVANTLEDPRIHEAIGISPA